VYVWHRCLLARAECSSHVVCSRVQQYHVRLLGRHITIVVVVVRTRPLWLFTGDVSPVAFCEWFHIQLDALSVALAKNGLPTQPCTIFSRKSRPLITVICTSSHLKDNSTKTVREIGHGFELPTFTCSPFSPIVCLIIFIPFLN